VIQPQPTNKRYNLLFSAVFGEFPTEGSFANCRPHFEGTLDGKQETIQPAEFHKLFARKFLYPLRVGRHQLSTYHQGWTPDPMLFYMDEREPYDIIEFWNLRALGWRIWPLPRSLAPSLTGYCEEFITNSHRPYPPPSNAGEDASFLCSRTCPFDEMQQYVSKLKRPPSYFVTHDWRFPRLWEEWGRHADHAEPQLVECEIKSADAMSLGGSILSVATVLPEFIEKHQILTPTHACTNVLESFPDGAAVIPWQLIDPSFFATGARDERVWVGREGICSVAGEYASHRHLRLPNSFNVFTAWAQRNGLEIQLSAPGRTAEQMINALGGLGGARLIGNEELIKVLDRMANGTLEIDAPGDSESGSDRRRPRKSSIPLHQIQQVLKRANNDNAYAAENHLAGLLGGNVLALGVEVPCSECEHATWFALEQLSTKLKCSRCLREFDFPLTRPNKITWSYRVQGPFAVENYAHGAYCVGAALHFLSEELSHECTWITSFTLRAKDQSRDNAEADFGAFLKPAGFSELTDPVLVLGECKTFGDFESRDFDRVRAT
jgi:hypothetical protein